MQLRKQTNPRHFLWEVDKQYDQEDVHQETYSQHFIFFITYELAQ